MKEQHHLQVLPGGAGQQVSGCVRVLRQPVSVAAGGRDALAAPRDGICIGFIPRKAVARIPPPCPSSGSWQGNGPGKYSLGSFSLRAFRKRKQRCW